MYTKPWMTIVWDMASDQGGIESFKNGTLVSSTSSILVRFKSLDLQEMRYFVIFVGNSFFGHFFI